jgi:hypothetical protein
MSCQLVVASCLLPVACCLLLGEQTRIVRIVEFN